MSDVNKPGTPCTVFWDPCPWDPLYRGLGPLFLGPPLTVVFTLNPCTWTSWDPLYLKFSFCECLVAHEGGGGGPTALVAAPVLPPARTPLPPVHRHGGGHPRGATVLMNTFKLEL